jgi:hypothetical protein
MHIISVIALAEPSEFNLGRYVREHHGSDIVVLRSDDDVLEYESATIDYNGDGNRGTLCRRLLALGLPTSQIRWHAAHSGQKQMTWGPGDSED